MKTKHNSQLRMLLAKEAARLMYEEGISQYFTAKRIAAKRLLGQNGNQHIYYRPKDLPSNGEIQQALLTLSQLYEQDDYWQRLFAMRVIALQTMTALQQFQPALIGSVSTGHVRNGSDIDIHVFTDHLEYLETHLKHLNWDYQLSEVTIRKNNQFHDYVHIHCQREFMIELSIYTTHEIKVQQRSSTDGNPIQRIKMKQLEALIALEHTDAWLTYLETGHIQGLDIAEAAQGRVTFMDGSQL